MKPQLIKSKQGIAERERRAARELKTPKRRAVKKQRKTIYESLNARRAYVLKRLDAIQDMTLKGSVEVFGIKGRGARVACKPVNEKRDYEREKIPGTSKVFNENSFRKDIKLHIHTILDHGK